MSILESAATIVVAAAIVAATTVAATVIDHKWPRDAQGRIRGRKK